MRADGGTLRTEVRYADNGSAVIGLSYNESVPTVRDGVAEQIAWRGSDGGREQLDALQRRGERIVLVFTLEGQAVLYAYSMGC